MSTQQRSENDILKEVIEYVHARSRHFGILFLLAEMISFIKEQGKSKVTIMTSLCVRG